MALRIRCCRWWLCLLLVLSSAALAQEHSAQMELRHNLPFVQVMVNGKGPFTFGIDTGTGGQALITPALSQELALPAIGEAEIGDPSGRNSRKAPIYKIATLTLAGVEFKDVSAVQFQPSSREGQCDGILGFVLFRDYLMTLDYPRQRLTLATGTLKPDGGKTVLPFTMPQDVPTVELTVGSRSIEAHLDSRGRGLGFPETFAQGLKFIGDPIILGRGRTVSNDFEIKGAQLDGDVRLGQYTFHNPFIEINPVLPLANFGAIPMRNFAVTFDQEGKLVRLEAAQTTIDVPPPALKAPMPAAASPAH